MANPIDFGGYKNPEERYSSYEAAHDAALKLQAKGIHGIRIDPEYVGGERYFALRWPNPTTGMTAKGRRMHDAIKAGGGSYAPSAVVYGKAKASPGTGLVTKKWAK